MADEWYSDHTPVKLHQFQGIVQAHLRIVRGIFFRHRWAHRDYLYLDLNAGPGRYASGDAGSPLIFIDAAERTGIPYRAWFFEQDPGVASRLGTALDGVDRACGRSEVIVGDHRTMGSRLAGELRQIEAPVYGLIYLDPPGSPVTGSVEVVRDLLAGPRCCRMDVLVYVAATNQKRVARSHGRPHLLDDLAVIGKRHVWLRLPQGRHQWTFAILTDWNEFPEFRRMGFRRLGTPEGDELAERLNFSRGERMESAVLPLPFAGIQRTGPTPSTCDIHGSARCEARSWPEPVGGASDVPCARQLRFTTCDIRSGANSTRRRTWSRSATTVIARSTGRKHDG